MLNYTLIKKLKMLTTPSRENSVSCVPQQPCSLGKLSKFAGQETVRWPRGDNMDRLRLRRGPQGKTRIRKHTSKDFKDA